MNPWLIAFIVSFVVVVLACAGWIVVAVDGMDEELEALE